MRGSTNIKRKWWTFCFLQRKRKRWIFTKSYVDIKLKMRHTRERRCNQNETAETIKGNKNETFTSFEYQKAYFNRNSTAAFFSVVLWNGNSKGNCKERINNKKICSTSRIHTKKCDAMFWNGFIRMQMSVNVVASNASLKESSLLCFLQIKKL